MKLDLSEIARVGGMHATQEIEEQCPQDLGFECTGTVKGKLEFTNAGNLLLITGDIKTELKLQCSRCLVDMTLPVEAKIEEEFRLEKLGDAVRVLPLEEEDAESELVKDNILDIQEVIRQNLLLELPIQPLCRPDCRGLCPTCGENLNLRKCACPPAEPESPFKVLGELLEEQDTDP